MPEEEIGKITHYFPKVSVAVVELRKPLKAGDSIKVVTHEGSFTQEVASMQLDHVSVQEAAPGQSIGLKVSQRVHEGNKVLRVS
jgi:putative protease